MKRAWTALTLAAACLCAACASHSPGAGCTVPPSICQANPPSPAPGSPPTCGLCPAEDLIGWIERKGCQYGPNLSCAQGQIYGYQGKSYCCQSPPYTSGAAPAGGRASGRDESPLSVPGASGERGGGKSGGGCPTGCTAPPPGCAIKGNINRKTGDRVYHLPGQKHYDEVTVEPEAGERWFCTEDEAQASGWRKSKT
jgi:hypothetical protein